MNDGNFNHSHNNIKSQNFDTHKKACDSGFQNAIIKNVDDFYVQMYIFFKGSPFCNTVLGFSMQNRTFMIEMELFFLNFCTWFKLHD